MRGIHLFGKYLLPIVLIVANIIVVGILGYAIPRGVDVTDEGMALLLSEPTRFVSYALVNYNVFFQHWHTLTDHIFSLFELRILRIVLVVIGSAALYFCTYPLFRTRSRSFLSHVGLLVLILLSGWVNYIGYQTLTPGYNTFIFFLCQVFLAVFFLWWRTEKMIYPFILGVLVFAMWLTKFTVAFTLPFISFAIYLLSNYSSSATFRKHFSISLLIVAALPIGLMQLYSLFGYPFTIVDYLHYIQHNPDNTHGMLGILVETIRFGGSLTIAGLSGALAAFLPRQYVLFQKRPMKILQFILIAVVSFSIIHWQMNMGTIGSWIVFGSAFFMGYTIIINSYSIKIVLPALLIFLAPLALAFGTNNSLVMYSFALCQFLIVPLLYLEGRSFIPLSVLLIIIVPYGVYNRVIEHPKRQAPLKQHTEKLAIPHSNRHILVTPATNDYISRFQQIMKQSKSELAIGSSRIMAEFYFSGVQYPQRILWFQENITNDYFHYIQNDVSEFTFVLTNPRKMELFAPHLDMFQMTLFAKLPRREFLIETRNFNLYYEQAVTTTTDLDTLYFYNCKR